VAAQVCVTFRCRRVLVLFRVTRAIVSVVNAAVLDRGGLNRLPCQVDELEFLVEAEVNGVDVAGHSGYRRRPPRPCSYGGL
jgi:hypothetical protein